MRLIIAGGRDFKGDGNAIEFLDSLHSGFTIKEVCSGRAQGADAFGEMWAMSRGIKRVIFPANWTGYGRSAGPIRNKEMAKYADALCAFWNWESPGTRDMINKMRAKEGSKIFIYGY